MRRTLRHAAAVVRVQCVSRSAITAPGRIADLYAEVIAAAVPVQTSVGTGREYFCGTDDRIETRGDVHLCDADDVRVLPLSQWRPSKFTGQMQMKVFV